MSFEPSFGRLGISVSLRAFLLPLIFCALVLLPGCGGGRSGTNTGGGVRVEIFVANESGEPVVGAVITDEASGETAATDERGVAEIQVRAADGEYRVFVEDGGISQSIRLNEEAQLDEGRSYLALIALSEKNEFELISIVEEEGQGGQPTPAPTRTPASPRPSPTPTLAGGNNQTPTPQPPTPTATPFPSLTPTPTVSPTPTPFPIPVILSSSGGPSGSIIEIESLSVNGARTPFIELSVSEIESIPKEQISIFSLIDSRQNSQNFVKIGASTLRVFLPSFRDLEGPVDVTAQFFVRVQWEASTLESDKFELRFISDGTDGEGSE